MPKFHVTDRRTGKHYAFDGPTEPTEAEIEAELYPTPTLLSHVRALGIPPRSSLEALGNVLNVATVPLLPEAEHTLINATKQVPLLGPALEFLVPGTSSLLGLATAGLGGKIGTTLAKRVGASETPALVKSALTREPVPIGTLPRYASELDAAHPLRRSPLTPAPPGPPAYMTGVAPGLTKSATEIPPLQATLPIGTSDRRYTELLDKFGGTYTGPERRSLKPVNVARRDLHDFRREVGSERVARQTGLTREQVRDATPEIPAGQLPQKAERAYLANPDRYGAGVEPPTTPNRLPFREDQRGIISSPLLRTLVGSGGGAALGASQNPDEPLLGAAGGAALGAAAMNPMATLRGLRDLRTTALLSGYAPAKSTLGNLGAAVNASLLEGRIAPIKEMLRVPTNLRNARTAWQAGANPANIAGMGRFNLPGRFMGAWDIASQQALERAGLSTEAATNLLLTEPNQAAKALGLKNAVGEYFVPFQKTNFNQLKGIENIVGKNPNFSRGRQMALAGGYGALGYGAGQQTHDPVSLGLLAAFAGPFGAPFLLGAAGSAGAHAAESLTPVPGYTLGEGVTDPLRWARDPGFTRLFR